MADLLIQVLSYFKDPNVAAAVTAVATGFAALASLFAVGVSIYALIVQVRHDRKSVQPIPQIVVGDFENHLRVAIENAGIGPLTISSFKVTDANGDVRKSIIEFMPNISLNFLWDNFVEEIEGRTIPAQDSLEVLSFSGQSVFGNIATVPNFLPETYESIRQALGELTVELKGTDIYGKRLQYCSRKLDWFLRNKEGAVKSIYDEIAVEPLV